MKCKYEIRDADRPGMINSSYVYEVWHDSAAESSQSSAKDPVKHIAVSLSKRMLLFATPKLAKVVYLFLLQNGEDYLQLSHDCLCAVVSIYIFCV